MARFSKAKKWVSTGGWGGYEQPKYAIAGASDTGSWSDSPAPSGKVLAELKDFANFLRKSWGFHVAMVTTRSSNLFMVKRWLIVPPEEYEGAKRIVQQTLEKYPREYIHEAD